MIGRHISHYRVLSELGSGGMGVVYLAEDTALNRKVALKFLKPDTLQSVEAEARLVREARSASALDHPNVATIYEIGEWEGHHFIAMAYYEGETFAARLARGAMPVDELLGVLCQVVGGLVRAHAAGIVHRDLKPANIMLTSDGVAKILDFGLASHEFTDGPTVTRLTLAGTTLGTVSYMSPEQASGGAIDQRADIWAVGVMAYEALAGHVPFRGVHPAAILHSIRYEPPPEIEALRPGVPDRLRDVIAKALDKDPGRRYQSAAELTAALDGCRGGSAATASTTPPWLVTLRRPAVAIPILVATLALAIVGARAFQQVRNERWARETAIPEVARLVEAEQFADAFAIAERATSLAPQDPILARLLPIIVRTPTIRTDPPGAAVSYKDYRSPDAAWTSLGVTPLEQVRVPNGFFRWRFEKSGLEPVEMAAPTGAPPGVEPPVISADLVAKDSAPGGMVRVPGSPAPYSVFLPGFEHLQPVRLTEPFWIDRFEVSNAEFKVFVEAGGYKKPEYWREAFVDAGRPVRWETAIARFRDATGRPGPATWVQGEFPLGQEDLPVGGVSWYEAAAYARFVGKSLPTIYHWTRAADPRSSLWVVPLSNFEGNGPTAVGSRHALHPFGTLDMAGNVKEWVANDSGDGRRYILGGGWDEPTYTFNEGDARSPFDRLRTFGFRLVKYGSDPDAALASTVVWPTRDYSKEKPAPDDVFQIYRRAYAYDRAPFRADVQDTSDSDEGWRREQIEIPTAYGNERMKLFLFLPKKAAPPFQTVVFLPGSTALRSRSLSLIPVRQFDFIIKSGRAVAFPVLKGTYDRSTEIEGSTASTSVMYRDHLIAWVKDFSRSVDYLETRKDLSLDRLALVGVSWGGRMGAIIPAVDERVKVEVLIIGGFSMQHSQPEVDQIHFASRVRIPVLMLNGRYDFFFPFDASQKPMFETLGTPKEDKRHLLFDGGHGIPRLDMIKETLDWLDRYQGQPGTR